MALSDLCLVHAETIHVESRYGIGVVCYQQQQPERKEKMAWMQLTHPLSLGVAEVSIICRSCLLPVVVF